MIAIAPRQTAYRALWLTNLVLLIGALFMFFGALGAMSLTGWPIVLFFLLWPWPQLFGLLKARGQWVEGNSSAAFVITWHQFVVVALVDILYLTWVFQ